jgi:phosphoribosylanthranilate isomerase
MHVGVKICGLTRAEDVDDAIDAGADAIGLVLAASPRRVDRDLARKLLMRIPREVTRIAVVRAPDAEVVHTLEALPFDVIQCDVADVPTLTALRRPLLCTFHDGADLAARIDASGVGRGPLWSNGFLVDGPDGGGKGVRADFDRAKKVAHRGGMVLAGGLDSEIVGLVVRHVRPAGVDVSSGVESAPGKKDRARMRAFVQAVRGEQRRSAE